MFKEMDKIVNKFDSAILSTVEPKVKAVISELLERDFEGRGSLTVGFKCGHCNHKNLFDGDDADYMEAHGIKMYKKVDCEKCEKESLIED
tara:strand:- start:256 stop:525 length:270 start_codon:yes stop_codon:yes gene_type:complete